MKKKYFITLRGYNSLSFWLSSFRILQKTGLSDLYYVYNINTLSLIEKEYVLFLIM